MAKIKEFFVSQLNHPTLLKEEKKKFKELTIVKRPLCMLVSVLIGLFFGVPLIGYPINLLMLGNQSLIVMVMFYIPFLIIFIVVRKVYYDLLFHYNEIESDKKLFKKIYILDALFYPQLMVILVFLIINIIFF